MRFQKLQELYNYIKSHHRICMLKGPPGSGKSFLANLFHFYLRTIKKLKENQVFYIVIGHEQHNTFEKLIKHFNEKTKLDFYNLKYMKNEEYFFIFDEVHNLYSKEKYEGFWEQVKHCSEGANAILCHIF